MNWYLKVLQNYATFSGRAQRAEYWYFVLVNVIISIVLSVVDVALGTYDQQSGQGLIGGIYSLAILIPAIAVGARRMHDVGKSGWFLLIPFYNLYLAVQPSQPGTNDYGPNPLNPEGDISDHLVG